METIKKKWPLFFLLAVGLMFVIILVFFTGDKEVKGDDELAEDSPVSSTGAGETEANELSAREMSEEEILANVYSEEVGVDEFQGKIEEQTKEAMSLLYREHVPSIGDGEEYAETDAGLLKSDLINLASQGTYSEILDMQSELTASHRFSEGVNLDIAAIFHDVTSVSKVINNEDKMDFINSVKDSYSPEMLMISTLYTKVNDRHYIIEDVQSISPVNAFQGISVEESRVLRSYEDGEEEPLFEYRNIAQEIFDLYDDVNSVYAYDITLEDLDMRDIPMTVYIMEDLYGQLTFYGMYVPDDYEHYEQTVAFWIERQPIYEQAEEDNQDASYEGEKLTEEDIDRFFESGW